MASARGVNNMTGHKSPWLVDAFRYATIYSYEQRPDEEFEIEMFFIQMEMSKNYKLRNNIDLS